MIKSYSRFCILVFFCFCTLFAKAQSVGGSTSGGATYCSNSNSGFLSLTGFTGSILNWESSTDGGATWTNIGNITSTQSYLNLSITTCYRAIVQNGSFPADTSTVSCITIFQPSNAGTLSGGGTFCSVSDSDSLTLSGIVGDVLFWQFSTDGGATWTTISDTNTFLLYSGITVNTLYTAVVQNAACPTDTSTTATFMILPPSVGGAVTSDDTVCSAANSGIITLGGNTGSISGWIASVDGGLTWTSIPGTGTSQSYSALTQTTTYAVVVQNGACAADTSTAATITVLAPFAVSAGADTTISPGESVTLSGSGTGTAVWSPPAGLDNSTIFSPVSTPVTTTTYLLTVIDPNGCVNSDDVTITVISPTFSGYITTIFTPNGDGINETWHIESIENYPDSDVKVFNIYGQVVYEKQNYLNDWKGTYEGSPLPDGTYFFVLSFSKDEDLIFKGSLDILKNK